MCNYKLKFSISRANHNNNNFKMLHDEYFLEIRLCRPLPESSPAAHSMSLPAKYRKDLRPCLVLLTMGNKSMFVSLKLYFVFFIVSRFAMGVGASPGSNFFCDQHVLDTTSL